MRGAKRIAIPQNVKGAQAANLLEESRSLRKGRFSFSVFFPLPRSRPEGGPTFASLDYLRTGVDTPHEAR